MKVRFAVSPAGGSSEADLLALGDALEASDFDGVWLSDLPATAVVDPLLGLAMLAGRTERLRLGANVVPLGRNPFLLAKALANLDRLSGGRLLLSFVTGIDHPDERQILGLDGVGRGALLEEVLGLLRAWWLGERVEHDSPRWQYAELSAPVRPLQEPLEVWLGGRGPKALERVGRVADGWLGSIVTPDEARAARLHIQAAAELAGREVDPEHFGLSIAYARMPPDEAVLEGIRTRCADVDPLELLPLGAEALRSLLSAHIDAGLSKFVLRPAGAVRSWDEEIEWLGTAVLDLQSGD
jgi:probable F420-dependent oxidoreductase